MSTKGAKANYWMSIKAEFWMGKADWGEINSSIGDLEWCCRDCVVLLFMAVCRHWDEALTSCRITHVRLVSWLRTLTIHLPPILVHLEKLYQLNCCSIEFVNRGSDLKLACEDYVLGSFVSWYWVGLREQFSCLTFLLLPNFPDPLAQKLNLSFPYPNICIWI